MKIDQSSLALTSHREYADQATVSFTRQMLTPAQSQAALAEGSDAGPSFVDLLAARLGVDLDGLSGQGELVDGVPARAAPWQETQARLFAALRDLIVARLWAMPWPFKKEDGADKEIAPASSNADALVEAAADLASPMPMARAAVPRAVLHMEMERTQTERTSFTAAGQVRTADGQTFDLAVDLCMERQNVNLVRDSFLLDPLVIDFDGDAAELTDDVFNLDLDCDGTAETLPMLGQGRGFLCWDQDEDGGIKDGSELFGALSGDGFADLALHDEDGNGWIDESDDIYDRLSVWMPGEEGLLSARDVDLGAIYLGSVSTEFHLVREEQALGVVRRSGIGLKESGLPVTIQQIDLAVLPEPEADGTDSAA